MKCIAMIKQAIEDLEKVHGPVKKEIELHDSAVSVKFDDNASYTVSISRVTARPVLDNI